MFAFICKRPDYAINGDYEVSIAIEKVIIPVSIEARELKTGRNCSIVYDL
jgi:hypothetical protein